jgi:ABC-2 type transport system ATP-binding protein
MSTLLQVQGLEKSFGAKKALRGISLSIQSSEIISLLGVNGAGKTTLSSILATLRPPTKGDILFQGKSIYKNITHYRQHIGYCSQKPNLNPHFTLR